MSSLKMTFSLTSLIVLIAFGLVFVAPSAMAHLQGTDSDTYDETYHDGDATTGAGTTAAPLTATTTPTLASETDHTHRAAPTVTSIELVDVKIGAATTRLTAGESSVSGTSVILVDDADAADDAAVAKTVLTETTPGQFRIKITFSEAVYVVGQANNFGPAPASGETGFPADTDLAVADILDSAVSLAAPTARLGDGVIAFGDIVRDGTDGTTFLATGTVLGANVSDVPIDVWISVSENVLYSKGNFDPPDDLWGRGNAASDQYQFSIVKELMPTADTTAPTVMIDPPTALDAMGKAVFTLKFSEPLADSGLGALTVSDIEITGGTAMATDLSDPTAGTGDDEGKEIYTLTVTPEDPNASVTIALRADSITDAADKPNVLATMDAMDDPIPSTMATYDKAPPMITVASVAGTGDNAGKVIFTIDSNEALSEAGLSIKNLRVSNTGPLKVADLMMVKPVAPATLPDGVKARYTLTITPTDATMPNVLDIDAGAVADMSDNMSDGVRHEYTPAATTGDGVVDTGPPPTAGQIGSKDYLVLVPDGRDASALPDPEGIAIHEITDMPDLGELLSTGGTIDVAVTGKANHDVIITEIMVARDIGKRGVATGSGRPEAGQWIEIYNNTAAHINISDIKVTFTTGFPAAAAPADATDRFSNVVSGAGWGFAATFPGAVSGQTAVVTGSTARAVVAGGTFTSLRRVYKNDATTMLQDVTAADQILNGWLSSTWTPTASTRVFLAGRIGTPGSENRPTVFAPAVYVAPSMTVRFNEIANRSDDSNEWIELKGPADYNLRHHTIKMVTGYDKATDTGTESVIYAFPTDADVKIPAGGILLLTDQDPVNNELAADLEKGVAKPVRYRVVELAALPHNGNFLLVLRDKDGANILDVAGHLAGLDDDNPYTLMYPLKANAGVPAGKEATKRISPNNKLAGGNVYKRAQNIQGHLANKDDGTEPAFAGAGFTGIGYDRQVSVANKEHHGTPGYPNGVQIAADAITSQVIISEIMYGNGTSGFPQWIELHNTSDTNGVDLHNWRLYIKNHSKNADDTDFMGKLSDEVWLRELKIPPNQTALIVTRSAPRHTTNLQAPQRILNLRRDKPLLSSKGFSLMLEAKSNEGDAANRQAGDEAGNLAEPPANSRADEHAFLDPVWVLPAGTAASGIRISIARRSTATNVAIDGTKSYGWVSSDNDTRAYGTATYYGRSSDVGSPGHTAGGVLPVSLSKFRPERLKETGEVVVRWITESELNNAGFNILRSNKRDGEFTKVHYVAGQGTTSERTVYEWKDKSAKPNVVYYYQIQDISLDGKVTTLRTTHLRGNVTAVGKATTTWGEIKALQ